MRIGKCIAKKTKDFIQLLCCPNDWVAFFFNHRIQSVAWGSAYIIMGIILNRKYTFPHFYLFLFLFLSIGIITFLCLDYFSKHLPQIINILITQPGARAANGLYYAFFKKSPIYVFVPITITLIFGIGGCTMFGAMKLTPVLFWILSLFVIVVYISIVGYLQYLFLYLYISKLANSKENYVNLQHNLEEYIPAELEWLQDLTKLCHIYRSAFFSLGSLYILSFGLFCFLPEMKTDIQNPYFFILWGIICIAIVVFFPITALCEHYKIKKIVLKLKKTYVKDLSAEINIMTPKETSLEIFQRRFFETMYITQIMNSKDYPINSFWNSIYDVSLSLFNIAASVVTVIQGIAIFLVDFRHMF